MGSEAEGRGEESLVTKQIGIVLDDEVIEQMRQLARCWGLPEIRHNTAVIARCVERVWMLEIGYKEYSRVEEQNMGSVDSAD